jgi:hypothetical protein
MSKICQKDVKKLSKNCETFVYIFLHWKWSGKEEEDWWLFFCQKVVKSDQKVAKLCQKVVKKLSKICQKVAKTL